MINRERLAHIRCKQESVLLPLIDGGNVPPATCGQDGHAKGGEDKKAIPKTLDVPDHVCNLQRDNSQLPTGSGVG